MFARIMTVMATLFGGAAVVAQPPAIRYERALGAVPHVPRGAPVARSPHTRQVSLELRENGALVTRSRVRLRLGMMAAIPVDGPYALRLRVDAGRDGGYMVRPTLARLSGTDWRPVATPAMAVTQGAPTRVTVAGPAAAPLEIAVRVD